MSDIQWLDKVIVTVKSICYEKSNQGKGHSINGFFAPILADKRVFENILSGYVDYPTEPSIYGNAIIPENMPKSKIPKQFCLNEDYRNYDLKKHCSAIVIDDPVSFEKELNSKLAELGFNSRSSHCTLIPRQFKEFDGYNILGFEKYKITGEVRYTIWIDISW